MVSQHHSRNTNLKCILPDPGIRATLRPWICVFVCAAYQQISPPKTARIQRNKKALKKPFGINSLNSHPSPFFLLLKRTFPSPVWQCVSRPSSQNHSKWAMFLHSVAMGNTFAPPPPMSNLGFSLRYLPFGRLACRCSTGTIPHLSRLLGLCRISGTPELLLLLF